VKFSGANLMGAMLDEANLTAAKFTGAQIMGMSIDGAHLRGADFSGAQGGTIEQFQSADLNSAKFNHHYWRSKPARLPDEIAQAWICAGIDVRGLSSHGE
jgi:uncharacterized protein YjbI with pentapeptide repeats